ncbi:hypothetical protein NFI96_029545 [Prochilodus magdalenae]|nr:hypothetical protein NFI96_029545 [Prochilodus magdalenae]
MCTSSGEEIDGYEGDSITITCSHKWASSNTKYFCKDPCKTDMDILVDSNKKSSGRYQLSDPGTGVFTVEIARLNKTDAGKYWCGVDRGLGDTYNEVVLKVHDGKTLRLSVEPATRFYSTTGLSTTKHSLAYHGLNSCHICCSFLSHSILAKTVEKYAWRWIVALCINIHLTAVMCTSSGEEIDGYEGDSITITCSHKWAGSNRKYFCKDPCETDMDILVDSNKKSSGRYQLMDSGKGVFTVEIARLNKTDVGKYWCGVDRALGDTYSEVVLKVHDAQQISLPPNLRTCCPTTVSSPNNISASNVTLAAVSLSAPARSDQTNDAKTLDWQIYLIVSVCAFILISAVWILVFSALSRKGKSLPQSRYHYLRLRQLSRIMCLSHIVFIPVLLKRKRAMMCTSSGEEFNGYERDTVTITCSHKWASSNTKYFCKDPCETDMDILVDSNKKSSGRYQLSDPGTGVFTVEIARLNKTDAGKYWCGVDRALGDTYNEVILKVHDAPQTSPPPTTSTHCPTTVSSTENISTPNATFAPVSFMAPAATPQSNNSKTSAVWQIYLIVSVCVVLLTSVVGILAFSALRYKASSHPNLESQRGARKTECDVSHCDGNSVSQSCPPAPVDTAESDYENIFTATTRYPKSDGIYCNL